MRRHAACTAAALRMSARIAHGCILSVAALLRLFPRQTRIERQQSELGAAAAAAQQKLDALTGQLRDSGLSSS